MNEFIQQQLVCDYEQTTLEILRKLDNSISAAEVWSYKSVLRVRLELLSNLQKEDNFILLNNWAEIRRNFARLS